MIARGKRFIAFDRERTVWQLTLDLATFVSLCGWLVLLVAYTLQWSDAAVPEFLRRVIIEGAVFQTIGVLLMLAGVIVYGLALLHLGDSWRIGIDRSSPGELVTTGIYGYLRHPIYVGFDLLFVGSFFYFGRINFLALAIALSALLHAMTRREERFLIERYGDAYLNYCNRVGRYTALRGW
jgi:protein-S-isoprenylcysteine O-methyltransferase Ste14